MKFWRDATRGSFVISPPYRRKRKGEGEEGVGVGTADGRTEIVRSADGLVGRSRAGGEKTNKSLAGRLLALKRGHHSALNELKHPVRYLT